jgi:hypothetical protein
MGSGRSQLLDVEPTFVSAKFKGDKYCRLYCPSMRNNFLPRVEVPTEKRVRKWAISLEDLITDPLGERKLSNAFLLEKKSFQPNSENYCEDEKWWKKLFTP